VFSVSPPGPLKKLGSFNGEKYYADNWKKQEENKSSHFSVHSLTAGKRGRRSALRQAYDRFLDRRIGWEQGGSIRLGSGRPVLISLSIF
jgi:hypothetical protein